MRRHPRHEARHTLKRAGAALCVRAYAAVALVQRGAIDGELALSYVIWPTTDLERASEEYAGRCDRYSEATRRRAIELVDSGLSWAHAGQEIGAPKQKIAGWVRASRRVSAGHLGATSPDG